MCSATSLLHGIVRHAARLGNARNLILGRGRADVRIEPAAGRGDQIDRHRRLVVAIGSVAMSATRCLTASSCAGFVGPKLLPVDAAALYAGRGRRPTPEVAADRQTAGRSARSRRQILPSRSIKLPLASMSVATS